MIRKSHEERKILLDTNFLLLPTQLKIDIFSELKRISDFNYSLFVIDKTINELEKIILYGNKNEKISARISKEIIKNKNINIINTKKHEKLNVDELILKYAKEGDFIVATLDKALKNALKNAKIIVITLRKSKYLIFG